MIIASAQIRMELENFSGSIEKHMSIIRKAAGHGADFILFPEMSLTGYERERAAAHALKPDDARLSELRDTVKTCGIIAVVGAPVVIGEKLHIGSLILLPGGDVRIYVKQYLHPGEEVFFSSSFDHDPKVRVGEENVSFAVCFDIENHGHPRKAFDAGASMYAAGIFYSPKGMEGAHRTLSGYAGEFSMSVIMSNFCGTCRESQAGGRSAVWGRTGEKIIEAGADEEALLLVRMNGGGWAGEHIRLE